MVQRIDTSISFLAATYDAYEPLHIFSQMCDEGREVSKTEAGSGWGCAILGLRIQNLALLTCLLRVWTVPLSPLDQLSTEQVHCLN